MSPRHSSAITLEHVLLALLDWKPMHGYELYQELCAMTGISQVWNIKHGRLYAILDKLEEKGLLSSHMVQGETYPPRKDFQLTEAGKASLQTWLNTPVRRARDIRQEFLAKLIIAHRYGILPALKLIRIQQRACQAWIDELQTDAPPFNKGGLDEWLVYSFRINREQGALLWLKMCELEIERLLEQESTAEGLSTDR